MRIWVSTRGCYRAVQNLGHWKSSGCCFIPMTSRSAPTLPWRSRPLSGGLDESINQKMFCSRKDFCNLCLDGEVAQLQAQQGHEWRTEMSVPMQCHCSFLLLHQRCSWVGTHFNCPCPAVQRCFLSKFDYKIIFVGWLPVGWCPLSSANDQLTHKEDLP